MESASYPPFYDGSTAFYAGARSPVRTHKYMPRGNGDWAQNLVLPRGLAGLGQTTGSDMMFTASTLAGAAVGGGLVGWVASKKSTDGAKRGAVFSVSLTSVADGFRGYSQSPVKGALLVGGGLAGLWWVLQKL